MDINLATALSLCQADPHPPRQPDRVLRIRGVKTRRNNINVATWNVRTLYKIGQLASVIKEARRLQIDMLGVSETRWTGNGRYRVDENYEMIFAGKDTHEQGVGILIHTRISDKISAIIPKSERILLVRLEVKPKPIVIIQVYAPTAESSTAEINNFYNDLEEVMRCSKNNDVVFLMGDFNAKVGKDHGSQVAGRYALGEQNERGEMLVEFAERHDLVICNTWFKQHERRLNTWESPCH